jgi:hypothetical protein
MIIRHSAGARVALALIGSLLLVTVVDAKPKTDAQIKQAIIRESIASYPGNCPCPYNTARNGSSCGRRSAYSRAGGYAPMCYAADVSNSDVKAYRNSRH